MKALSWQAIAERLGRIRGISLPFGLGGMSWAPADDEKRAAEKIITYLEGQGIFSAPFEWEHPKETYDAAGSIRTELTKLLQEVRRDMSSYAYFKSIRTALQTFQRAVRAQGLADRASKSQMTNEEVVQYDQSLIKLRNTAAIEVARVCVACKLTGNSELMNWLP